MHYAIIADAGATKIEWALISSDGPLRSVRTLGLSGLLADRDTIVAIADEAARALATPEPPAEVFYYGAGCSTPEVRARMAAWLSEVWPDARVEVQGDMLLAARSLLGRSKGVACILGTGSNAVVAKDGEIVRSGAGLGFVFGDPGSGCEMGKRLLADYFKGFVPDDLGRALASETGVTLDSALENVYSRPAPNRYLASFARFVADHREHPYCAALIASQLSTFLLRDVCPLIESPDTRVAFTGSIAAAFEAELRTVAADLGLTAIGPVTGSPMEGIIQYHLSLHKEAK